LESGWTPSFSDYQFGARGRQGPGGPSARVVRPILDDGARPPNNRGPVGRRLLLMALLGRRVRPWSAGASRSGLEGGLARALAVPHVSRARTAALVFDLQSGTTVFARHDSLSLAPASNEKLGVTYAAVVGLGPEFRFETDVVGRGEQDGTVWR